MTRTSRHKQIMKVFSKRLKEAREQKYHSAAHFAGILGMDQHAYRKYERGQSEPRLETLTRICELLNITPNYLLPLAAGEERAKKEEPGKQNADDPKEIPRNAA